MNYNTEQFLKIPFWKILFLFLLWYIVLYIVVVWSMGCSLNCIVFRKKKFTVKKSFLFLERTYFYGDYFRWSVKQRCIETWSTTIVSGDSQIWNAAHSPTELMDVRGNTHPLYKLLSLTKLWLINYVRIVNKIIVRPLFLSKVYFVESPEFLHWFHPGKSHVGVFLVKAFVLKYMLNHKEIIKRIHFHPKKKSKLKKLISTRTIL